MLKKGCGCGCIIAIAVVFFLGVAVYLGISSLAEEGQSFFDTLLQMLNIGEKAEEAAVAA